VSSFILEIAAMLPRPLVAALCSVAIGALGLYCAPSAEAKDPEIKDGIPGTVVKVDAAQGTVTIAEREGRERTYSINEQTVIVGPRGGIVKSRLRDHRFHSGLPITVVAEGSTATELHLGYDRKPREARTSTSRSVPVSPPAESPAPTDSGTSPAPTPAPSNPAPAPTTSTTRTSRFRGVLERRNAEKDAAKPEEEDEDLEFPGKVKSVDPTKRMLVVTLVNGKDRSFLVASDVKVLVNSRASRHGLSDPALQPGTPLTVVTATGGRKVLEVKVTASRRAKKAA
jgi:hypothetical protein